MGDSVKDLFRKKKKAVSKAKPQVAAKSTPEPSVEDDAWSVPEQQEPVVFVGGKGVGQLSTVKRETETDLAVKVVAEDTRQMFHQVRAKAALGPTSPPATPTTPAEEAPKPLGGIRLGAWRSARAAAAEAGVAMPFKNKVEDFPALGPGAAGAAPLASKGSAWAKLAVPVPGEGEAAQNGEPQPEAQEPEKAPSAPAEPEVKQPAPTSPKAAEPVEAPTKPVSPPPEPAKAPTPTPPAPEAPAPVQPPAAPEPEKAAEPAPSTADLSAKFGKKKKKKQLDD